MVLKIEISSVLLKPAVQFLFFTIPLNFRHKDWMTKFIEFLLFSWNIQNLIKRWKKDIIIQKYSFQLWDFRCWKWWRIWSRKNFFIVFTDVLICTIFQKIIFGMIFSKKWYTTRGDKKKNKLRANKQSYDSANYRQFFIVIGLLVILFAVYTNVSAIIWKITNPNLGLFCFFIRTSGNIKLGKHLTAEI